MPDHKKKIGIIGKRIHGRVSIRINPEVHPDINAIANRLRRKLPAHISEDRKEALIQNALGDGTELDDEEIAADLAHIKSCTRCQDKFKSDDEIINMYLSRAQGYVDDE